MAAVSVLFLFGLGVTVDSALYYNKVHAGVRVLGHSLGGLTRDEATAALTRLVDQSRKSPIVLASGDRTWAIKPDDMDTEMDVAGAVAAAMDVSRESNLFVDLGRRFKLYFSGRDVPLEGKLDRRLIDEFVAGIAEEVDVAPVNPGLAIDGTTVKAVEGQKGRVVDQSALSEQVSALLISLHATTLTVPLIAKDPAIRAEDTQKAVDQAKTMMASPVVVKSDDETWQLTPKQIAAYVDFVSEDRAGVSTLVPYLSAEKMDAFFDEIADSVLKKPVNATFKGDGERAWVVPGAPGQALDSVKTAAALTQASLKTSGRIAEVAVKLTEPDRTTAEAEAMGMRDKLGSFTTKWEGTADRQTNVRVATKYASNVILAPGDVYNFDKQIGPRNAKRGYRLAPGIVGPGKLDDVFGGGICQVSTTLFNAVFFAGLEVVERKNHSIYIDHYPKGRDATVTADGPNLRFRNDTKHYILVRGASDGVNTTFVIYGTDEGREINYTTSDFYNVVARTDVTIPNPKMGPGTTVIRLGGQSGKVVKVVRTVKAADGTVIHQDNFVSTWRMIPREIEVGTGTTTTAKKPTSTTGATRPSTSATSPPTTGF